MIVALLLQLAVSAPLPPAPARPFLAAISVASVERSVDWYTRNIGFRVIRAPSTPKPGIGSALLELDGFFLEIASLAESRTRTSALPVPDSNGSLQGVYKLAFWVSDFDAKLAALATAGVPLYRPEGVDSTMAGGVRYVLIRDPDETVIQIFGTLKK